LFKICGNLKSLPLFFEREEGFFNPGLFRQKSLQNDVMI